MTTAQLRGRPVVLNFWASWCLECRADHAALLAAWRHYASQGVAFVGVDYQDSMLDARGFLRQHGDHWPSLQDPNDSIAIDYGVYGVPETFLIDARGVVRFKFTGAVTVSQLSADLDQLLGSGS